MTFQTRSSDDLQLSIVVPMYNEQENAPDLLDKIARVINPLGVSWELVLVNDGSTDGTLAVIEEMSRQTPHVRVVSYTPNRGRGAALRRGFRACRGDWIISTDADLSYSPSYMPKMIEVLRSDPESRRGTGFPIHARRTRGGSAFLPPFCKQNGKSVPERKRFPGAFTQSRVYSGRIAGRFWTVWNWNRMERKSISRFFPKQWPSADPFARYRQP